MFARSSATNTCNWAGGTLCDGMGDADGESGVVLARGVRVDLSRLEFTFLGSRGPGGQNVNRRATRARLRVSLDDLPLSAGARRRLEVIAKQALTESGELVIERDETRSQGRNKEACLEQLREYVRKALVVPKARKKTKPSKRANQRRIDEKKRRGDIKRRRSGDDLP